MQGPSFNPERGRSIMPSFRSPLSRAVAIVTAVTITAHLVFIGLPSINFEWAFVDAARYFGLHQQELLVRYFDVEANPLGVPLLAYIIHLILPFLEIDIIPRLLAISRFAFLAFALLRISERAGIALSAPLLTAIVFLNPLIWTFGGRGTADFFPAALALCAVAMFWDAPDSARRRILAVALFGLAIIMKYHADLLLPLVWLEELSRPGTNHKNALVRLCNFLRYSPWTCDLCCGCETVFRLLARATGLSGNTPPFTDAKFRYHQFHQLFGIYCPASHAVFILAIVEACAFALGRGQDYRWWAAPVHTRLFRCRSDWGNGLWPP